MKNLDVMGTLVVRMNRDAQGPSLTLPSDPLPLSRSPSERLKPPTFETPCVRSRPVAGLAFQEEERPQFIRPDRDDRIGLANLPWRAIRACAHLYPAAYALQRQCHPQAQTQGSNGDAFRSHSLQAGQCRVQISANADDAVAMSRHRPTGSRVGLTIICLAQVKCGCPVG